MSEIVQITQITQSATPITKKMFPCDLFVLRNKRKSKDYTQILKNVSKRTGTGEDHANRICYAFIEEFKVYLIENKRIDIPEFLRADIITRKGSPNNLHLGRMRNSRKFPSLKPAKAFKELIEVSRKNISKG